MKFQGPLFHIRNEHNQTNCDIELNKSAEDDEILNKVIQKSNLLN